MKNSIMPAKAVNFIAFSFSFFHITSIASKLFVQYLILYHVLLIRASLGDEWILYIHLDTLCVL
jgi:hypothetical protein